MILRVLTARVPNQNIGQFNELLRAQLRELREQPGLVYVKLARRLDDDNTEEVVLVEEWRTTADLFEWTRGRLTTPRLLRGTEELVENLIITHYEALDVSPEDLQRRVLGPAGVPGMGEAPRMPSDATDDRVGDAAPIEAPEPAERARPTEDAAGTRPGAREATRETSPT